MPGLGDRLHARRGVDEIAGDHALALGAERHRRLAGEDAGPRAKLRRADLVAERRHGGDEVERRAHGALGVVLGRGRRAPDGHHRVADELLDRAAVELDQPAARVEVAGEELAHLLGVAALGERREADEVGEEDGDEAALGRGRARYGSRRRRRCAAAPSAVPHSPQNFAVGAFGVPHDGHVVRERRPAFAAELPAGLVRRAACWTGNRLGHGPTLVP